MGSLYDSADAFRWREMTKNDILLAFAAGWRYALDELGTVDE
jgi:hypothetical protein